MELQFDINTIVLILGFLAQFASSYFLTIRRIDNIISRVERLETYQEENRLENKQRDLYLNKLSELDVKITTKLDYFEENLTKIEQKIEQNVGKG